MKTRFSQGDTVRVRTGQRAGREGAIYNAIGIPRQPWMRRTESGGLEYRVYFDLGTDAEWFAEDELELVGRMPEPALRTGDRVRVRPNASWARGELGTVNAGGWDASLTPRISRRPKGPTWVHMVHLDHPHPDATGDGSYVAGEFDEAELEPLDGRPNEPLAYPAARLEAEAEALRRVMANPELGKPIGRPKRPKSN
jgi:hypothetical protein